MSIETDRDHVKRRLTARYRKLISLWRIDKRDLHERVAATQVEVMYLLAAQTPEPDRFLQWAVDVILKWTDRDDYVEGEELREPTDPRRSS